MSRGRTWGYDVIKSASGYDVIKSGYVVIV